MVRYSDMKYFNSLPLKMGVELIYKAGFETEKQKHWEIYCHVYPHMGKDNFKTFEQFFRKKDNKPVKARPKEDLIKGYLEIEQKIATGNFKEVKF